MKTIPSLMLLIGICLFTACLQDTEPKETIYAEGFIRYLQSEKQFKSEIRFKAGDSLENASVKTFDKVLFQNNEMELQNVPSRGFRYSYEAKAPYKDELVFTFQDQDSKKHTLSSKMSPISSIELLNNGISKNTGIQLTCDGGILLEDESILVMVLDKDNKAASKTISGPTETQDITIENELIKNLKKGTGQIYLVKKKALTEKNSSIEADMEIHYYSRNISVMIDN